MPFYWYLIALILFSWLFISTYPVALNDQAFIDIYCFHFKAPSLFPEYNFLIWLCWCSAWVIMLEVYLAQSSEKKSLLSGTWCDYKNFQSELKLYKTGKRNLKEKSFLLYKAWCEVMLLNLFCVIWLPLLVELLTCFPLWVTEDRMVRRVLKPIAMSSKWAAKKKLLKCPKMDMVVYQIRYRKDCRDRGPHITVGLHFFIVTHADLDHWNCVHVWFVDLELVSYSLY